MYSIGGFACRLKTKTATFGNFSGTYPYQSITSSSSNISGNKIYPGKLVLNSIGSESSVNLFTYTTAPLYGIFAACGDAKAPFNDNSATTAAVDQ